MEVPCAAVVRCCWFTSEPEISMRTPKSSALVLVISCTCATAAILAMASPLKPLVLSLNKSAAVLIFEVAWRSKHMRASFSLMPLPLSTTCMCALPASLTTSDMRVAPASMAFSNSSLTTEAGLCTTSPAAI